MTDGQDPEIFINEAYYSRDELVDMGEVFNDDSIRDIVLEGFTDEYVQIKYISKANNYFTLDRAVITMRNMYANRAMRNGPSRNAKGREFGMVVTSTPSAVVICSHCEKQAIDSKVALNARERCRGKKLPQQLERNRGVACIIPIATTKATAGLKFGTTT